MKPVYRAHPGFHLITPLIAIILLLSLHVGFVHAQNAPEETATAQPSVPDVMVLLLFGTPVGNAGVLQYPEVVSRQQAESDLRRFVQETGWQASDIIITNGGDMQAGEQKPMTSTEFILDGTFEFPYTGNLPIEPIIKALKNYRDIEIRYILPDGFVFAGTEDFENQYVKIRLNRGTDYMYRITVKDSNFDDLGLATPGAQPAPPVGETEKGGGVFTTVLILMLAFVAAGVVFVLANRAIKKRGS